MLFTQELEAKEDKNFKIFNENKEAHINKCKKY